MNIYKSQSPIKAKKFLGQHFLNNGLFLSKILNYACRDLKNIDTIVEIGPGTGALTQYLLQTNLQIYSIETDKDLIAMLENKFPLENFHLIYADALKYDFANIPSNHKILVANLPYNISVPLMINFLQNTTLFARYSVLIQKEVAMRLAAKPSTKDYGRLSVLTQAFCDVIMHFDIPGNAFNPHTKVKSTFVSLIPKPNVNLNFLILSKLLEKTFSQRRKMIRVVLKDYPEILKAFINIGIKETVRAEEITLDQYILISKTLQSLNK